MKRKAIVMTLVLVFALSMFLIATGCSGNGKIDAPEFQNNVIVDFTKGASTNFERSGVWTNGDVFNVTWRPENVTFDNDAMQLKITDKAVASSEIPFDGGEYRSKQDYEMGRAHV